MDGDMWFVVVMLLVNAAAWIAEWFILYNEQERRYHEAINHSQDKPDRGKCGIRANRRN